MVLQDKSTSPTTYQIYLHLSKNTIPANFQHIDVPVNQGDWIANADNTGASWGSHLHFMVVTTIYNIPADSSKTIAAPRMLVLAGAARVCLILGTLCQATGWSTRLPAVWSCPIASRP